MLRKVEVSDGSDFFVTDSIIVPFLKIDAEDGSSVRVFGRADTLVVEASDAADIHLENFNASVGSITATDASSVQLGTIRNLQIEASDASEVEYAGQPEQLFKQVSRSSSVVKIRGR